MSILQEQKSVTVSARLKVAFGYSVIAPALLYLLHPCSRTAFAESAMDGANGQNAGAILFLLLFIRVLPQGLRKPSAIFFWLLWQAIIWANLFIGSLKKKPIYWAHAESTDLPR